MSFFVVSKGIVVLVGRTLLTAMIPSEIILVDFVFISCPFEA